MQKIMPPSLPFYGSPEENSIFYHAVHHAIQQGYSCDQILRVLAPPPLLAEYPNEAILNLEVLSYCVILTTSKGRAAISPLDKYQTANELAWRISQDGSEHPMFSMTPLPVQLDSHTTLHTPLNWLQPSVTLLPKTLLNNLTSSLDAPSDFWDQKYGTFALLSEPYCLCIDEQTDISRVAVHLGYFPPNTSSYNYTACIPLYVLFNQDLRPDAYAPRLVNLESLLVLPALDIHVLYQLFSSNSHWRITDGRSSPSSNSSKPFSLTTVWLQWNALFFVPRLPTASKDDDSLCTHHGSLPELATLTENLPSTATYAQRFEAIHTVLHGIYMEEHLLQLSC